MLQFLFIAFLLLLLPFVQLPLILGPAIFQMNSLRLLIIQKTGSTTLDLYKNLIISGTRMELEVYDTHYQVLCHNLNKHMSLVYQEQMSSIMRKLTFGICENKDTGQLRGNREADQRLCFRCIHSPIPLLS